MSVGFIPGLTFHSSYSAWSLLYFFTMRKLIPSLLFTGLLSIIIQGCVGISYVSKQPVRPVERTPNPTVREYQPQKIQIALLLDTSGSMERMLELAEGNFWFLVDELMSQYDGYYIPEIEIALYEYGSPGIGRRAKYMRQVVPLTYELDWISDELHHLSQYQYGRFEGQEYCGEVVLKATNELNWSNHPDDLKMIFIIGNESFAQGMVDYESAIRFATNQDIIVNTIFAGSYEEGIRKKWLDAASLGWGEYSNLGYEESYLSYYQTDYDLDICLLNEQINGTYIPYGSSGFDYWDRSQSLDYYAGDFGESYLCVRTIVKTRPWYRQSRWDLIDAIDGGVIRLQDIPDSDLPAYMRGLSLQRRVELIEKKRREREEFRKRILELSQNRRSEIRKKNDRVGINPRDAGLEKIITNSVNQRVKRVPQSDRDKRPNDFDRLEVERKRLEDRRRKVEQEKLRQEAEREKLREQAERARQLRLEEERRAAKVQEQREQAERARQLRLEEERRAAKVQEQREQAERARQLRLEEERRATKLQEQREQAERARQLRLEEERRAAKVQEQREQAERARQLRLEEERRAAKLQEQREQAERTRQLRLEEERRATKLQEQREQAERARQLRLEEERRAAKLQEQREQAERARQLRLEEERRAAKVQEQREQAEHARQQREAQERRESEARAQHEREERARQQREAQARRESEARAQREREERARQQREAQERRESEARAQREREERARQQREAQARRESEARAQREREERARQQREAQERRESETRAQREREERARQQREAQQRKEAAARAQQERVRKEAQARQKKNIEMRRKNNQND